MHPEQDNFEELRRLLAVKRHEQPPPGYFGNFSRQVITRIRAGETVASDSLLERLIAHAPWLRSLGTGFEAKPIVAGAFGIGVCGLLVFGLVTSERLDTPAGLASPSGEPSQTIFANVPSQTVGLYERAIVEHAPTGAVFSAQGRSSIFDELRKPVNYVVPASAN